MKTHRNCIVIVAVAAVLLSSSLSIGASVEVTGDFKLNGAGSGVVFPDGTVQTTASAPTWHQILPEGQRFVLVMDNYAVLDKETGLVWVRSPRTRASWYNAEEQCTASYNAGRFGWRLPTIQELASLIQYHGAELPWFLPIGHPFDLEWDYNWVEHWSITTHAAHPSGAWAVHFYALGWDGTPVIPVDKDTLLHVWCVRGGSGPDSQ